MEKQQQSPKPNEAPTGNASNPSRTEGPQPVSSNQLLDEKAEKYIRESASIEDLPDDEDEQAREKSE